MLFLAVGGLNLLVGYGCFAGLLLIGAGATRALVGATILGVLFNFKSTGSIVFGRSDRARLPQFVAIYLLQFFVNLGAMHALASGGVAPLAAEAVLLPVLAVASFLLIGRYVFPSDAAAGDVRP